MIHRFHEVQDQPATQPTSPGVVPDSFVAHEQERRLDLSLIIASAIAGILPPFVGNRLRSYILKMAGLRIGRGSIFCGRPTIIGDAITTNLTIGEECGFNVGCLIDVGAPITIGNRVGIGHHVMIISRTFAVGPSVRRAGEAHYAPIVIEDGAWIGARCTIMPGVTIGAGAVVGATMVISKDVPPNTLLLGPQKISLAKWRA
jgi:acetyltransferase-like isoleucine patch superfamily enzyme